MTSLDGVDTQVAGVLLVNRDDAILLQLRDGNTRIDPHRWCLPGGHVEPGEDPDAAAHRELAEETGLKADLELFWRGRAPSAKFPGAVGLFSIYFGVTDAVDAHVVCGEGAAMRFVAPGRIPSLEFGAAYTRIVAEFLDSAEFAALRAVNAAVAGRGGRACR